MSKSRYLKFNDVPVLLIGFNRPDFIMARVNELAHMPITKLYISLDGGYEDYDHKMKRVIDKSKKELKDIELLEVYQHDKNLGIAHHIPSAITNLLTKHSHIIVVEDDIILANNFFVNIIRGFNYQIKTKKRGIVGGFSIPNLSQFKFSDNKWRESKYCVIWGWGCSAEAWEGYNSRLDANLLKLELNKSQTWTNLFTSQQQTWEGRFKKTIKNPNFTWDIQLQYLSFKHDFINLYPMSTLTVHNGNSDARSTNLKNKKPKWMNNSKPDNRIISDKKPFFVTEALYNSLDANLLMSDTKMIKWYNNLKRKHLLFPSRMST